MLKNFSEEKQKELNEQLFDAVKKKHLPAVIAAVEAGANINTTSQMGYTPLLYSSIGDIKIMEYLLENGADPNIKNVFGVAPLHIAARDGDTLKIKLLLKYSADMYIKENYNETPFRWTYNGKHYDAADFFVLNGYVPCDEDFEWVKDLSERTSAKEHFRTLTVQVQEHKTKLKEEIEAAEFTFADEIIEM